MTTRAFGQVVPLQIFMLMLAGYGPSEDLGFRDIEKKVGYDDQVTAMIEGLKQLQDETGRNLGFSLSGWHEFLMKDQVLSEQYMHPYAWKGVRQAILAEINNSDREALEAEAEKRFPEVSTAKLL